MMKVKKIIRQPEALLRVRCVRHYQRWEGAYTKTRIPEAGILVINRAIWVEEALDCYAILTPGAPLPGGPDQGQQEVIDSQVARNLPGHDQA